MAIVREVLGQHAEQFADSRDGGRDGAFGGTWISAKKLRMEGETTIQCKFSAKRDKRLALSDVRDEIEKARRLAAEGLATNYILLTSMSVTGPTAERLKQKFEGIPGLKNSKVFGAEWICTVIRETPRLRMLVPRIYGLGDLSQIMDERAAAQAKEILASMGDDLSKIVITNSYRESARALREHGFVLLLGEPAAGKSTIAASLSIAAIDNWEHTAFKIRNAEEFVIHSNPHDPRQFFWVDDAFGATQVDYSTANEWNRAFPHMYAAIKRGAKVLFTSRDYIFRAVKDRLKQSAFPLLKESQVVIRVEDLTDSEKDQILYNHIRLGRQPQSIRAQLKPFLQNVSRNCNFKPEIARRLGDPFFTKTLPVSAYGLQDFVERPMDHLQEVLRTLDAPSKSALAMIFMRGGTLPSPVKLSPEELNAAELLGGNKSSIRESLTALTESLVLNVTQDGKAAWKFKHPTIRDALASNIAADSELLDIYLAGADVDRIFREVTCGITDVPGVKVVVPEDRYAVILDKIGDFKSRTDIRRWSLLRFLRFRSDKSFMRAFLGRHHSFVDGLRVESYLENDSEVDLLVKLNQFGLLSQEKRESAVWSISELAIKTPDAGFLATEIRPLLTDEEVRDILETVKAELLPRLYEVVLEWQDREDEGDLGSRFDMLSEALREFRLAFADDDEACELIDAADGMIDDQIQALEDDASSKDEPDYSEELPRTHSKDAERRSIFDDVEDDA